MEVCRTCMNERGSELVGDDFCSIFSHLEEEDDENVYIADYLAQWVGRTIDENDGMPSDICKPCLEAIRSIALFIENAKECDKKLRKWLFSADTQKNEKLEYVAMDSDMDIKMEPDEISADVLLSEQVSDGEQSTNQEDPITFNDNAEEEEYTPISRKRTRRSRKPTLKAKKAADKQSTDKDDDEEEEETPKRRKRRNISKRQRKPCANVRDKLDEKELETYNVVDVQDKIICCGCFVLFDNEADLEQHGKTVHEETKKINNPVNLSKRIVCQFCYRRFDRDTQRQVHRERYESIERVYQCKKCDKHFVTSGSRYQHAHNHPEWNVAKPTLYQVPMTRLEKYGYLCCFRNCVSSHRSEDSLFEHVRKHHNLDGNDQAPSQSGDIQCPFCLRVFETKAKLVGHYINRYTAVSNQREYQCHECGKIYSSQMLLTAHENRHAGVKPYECDVCLKRYYSEAVLRSHKLIHTQSKTLECSICGMKFRTKANLVKHYGVHSDEKPFECDVCHKPFKHSSTLFTHKKTHYPSTQYKCSVCGKGFADSGNLKRHMVSHTGIKPYQCGFCDKGFMRLAEKSDHESKVHEGVMPYACEVCGKQFSAKRVYQKHQQACGS